MAIVTDIKPSGIDSLKLTLNKEEILFLVDVLNNIGGCPNTSRRRISATLRDALANAGVDTDPTNPLDVSGNIYFRDDLEKTIDKMPKYKTYKGMARYDHDEAPF